tara:strand:+ start:138 stop:422 length:285 start_codon:yes stop_codon:yes gene_type:complete
LFGSVVTAVVLLQLLVVAGMCKCQRFPLKNQDNAKMCCIDWHWHNMEPCPPNHREHRLKNNRLETVEVLLKEEVHERGKNGREYIAKHINEKNC